MKNLKSKAVSTEVKCPACDGTAFPTVAQPANPGPQDFPASLRAVPWQGPNYTGVARGPDYFATVVSEASGTSSV